ncbi:MAG: hypothetical protein AB7F74_26485 [Parvibaculaceae bacterium]
MSDMICTPPITVRRFGLPRLELSRIGVSASLCAIAGLLGYAFNLAYVDPYTSLQRPAVIPDNDLEGRDPNW